MNRFRIVLPSALLAIAGLLPLPALAWGSQGHRLVALVADTRLTPATRAEVDRLLAGEADPTLAAIAPWADNLRASDPDLGKRSAAWHYVNIGEDDCHYEIARNCPDGNCVVEALTRQSAILADATRPLAERQQALKFVVHFAGDIHQPMHAGYAHDKGGNDFQVHHAGRGTNLHSLWDSGMMYPLGLSDAQYLERLLVLPAPSADTLPLPARGPAPWAEASCRIAVQAGVYPRKRTISTSYVNTWRPVAEANLRLAGERLAVLLNTLLDPAH